MERNKKMINLETDTIKHFRGIYGNIKNKKTANLLNFKMINGL